MSPASEGTASPVAPPVAMVLAAGFGTRLRPLTEELPKPLVPVGDRSVLAHLCDTLAAAGVTRAVLNVHHLAERYDADLRASLAVDVAVVEERGQIRGTAGGVAGAREALGPGPVVVHNGDILATMDLAALLAHHVATRALATLAVGPSMPAGRGTVGLGAEGRVVRLRGHTFGEELASGDYAGVQVLSERGREQLPEEGCFVADVFIPALQQGQLVNTAAVVTAFSDVGTLADYGEANTAWLRRCGLARWVEPTAQIASGLSLLQTVVGAGAHVAGRGVVDRCVVWPGAALEAPARGVIATPEGRRVRWLDDASPATEAAAAPR